MTIANNVSKEKSSHPLLLDWKVRLAQKLAVILEVASGSLEVA